MLTNFLNKGSHEKKSYKQLQNFNIQLEQKVNMRTKELAESEAKFRSLNKTKDKFFSIIAHDLRAPLGGLRGMAELLYNDFDTFNEERLKS